MYLVPLLYLVPGQVWYLHCTVVYLVPVLYLVPGQVWYLLPMAWWTGWHAFVNWSEAPSSSGSLGRRKRAGQALSSSLASDSSPRVVATGQD